MRAEESWRPTKYVRTSRGLRGSRDPDELWVGSRHITDLVARFYAEQIPQLAGGDLVDLGCGKAPLYSEYRDRVRSVTLVDWANSPHDNPHLDRSQDLNAPLELADSTYGTVILSDVLEHIRRPMGLMEEVARILRPGGVLLMNVPFSVGLHEQPFDFYRYTRFSLEQFVHEAGLELVSLAPVGGWPDVMLDLSSKMLTWVPVVGTTCSAMLQAVGGLILRTRAGRLFSRRTEELWPLGYAVVARKPTTDVVDARAS